MKIRKVRIYTGPSIYGNVPVMHCKLAFTADMRIEAEAFGMICQQLPALSEQHRNAVAEFANGPLTAALDIKTLFEILCAELQRTAGCEVAAHYFRALDSVPDAYAIVAYEDAKVCSVAAELACAWLSQAAAGEITEAQLETQLNEFLDRCQRLMLPVQDRTVVRRAKLADIPVLRLVGRLLVLGQGRFQQRMSATKTTHTNIIGNDIAANKDYARRLLAACGLPIPKYDRMNRRKQAVKAARAIGYPVVVKPNNGQMGRGVSVGMRSDSEVRAAYDRAREVGRSALVEQLIPGMDYRMVVINGRFCAASKRVPAHVVGDGKSNIRELVDEVNSDPRRGEGPRFSWTRISIDEQAQRLLSELNYDLDTVPPSGEVIYLRRNANTSDGGTAVDVTDDVHPDNIQVAVRAAKAVGLDIAGVDILTEDITRSILKHGGAICEINSRPGLRKHLWPAEGKPRDVIGPILDMLFPDGGNGRAKSVIVTGTDAGARKSAARLLAQRLADQGCHVGLATHDGVEIDGHEMTSEHLLPDAAACMVLLDADVDAAVLELSTDEIIRYGISLDAVDVCCIVGAEKAAAARLSKRQLQRQKAALQVAASLAREAVVIVAEDKALHNEIADVSLAPLRWLTSISDLDAAIGRFTQLFQRHSRSTPSALAWRSPQRNEYRV